MADENTEAPRERRRRPEPEKAPLGSTPVPAGVPAQIAAIVGAAGHITLGQLGPAYAKEHPDSALTYREWGFERLRDYLATIESTVAVSPDGSGRGFVVTLPGAPVPVKAARPPKAAGGAGGVSAVTAGVAGAVAALAGATPEDVAKVLRAGKYKFTLDSLAVAVAADLARDPADRGASKARRGKGRPAGENAE